MTDRNEKYKQGWVRCCVCRTRRATFTSLIKHYVANPTHRPCTCEGYRVKHSPKSPCCVHNPDHLAYRAVRAGDHEAAILLPGKRGGDEPPF